MYCKIHLQKHSFVVNKEWTKSVFLLHFSHLCMD